MFGGSTPRPWAAVRETHVRATSTLPLPVFPPPDCILMRKVSKRSDSLVIQHKPQSQLPVFLIVEDELRDARRVHSHGQEEDLRQALQMVINRVVELSSMLKEACKNQAELETSLNLTKSNLQLVQSNNEMLEEALKRDASGSAKDVGWRRPSKREIDHRERLSEDLPRNSDYTYLRAEASPSQALSPPMSSRSALSLFSSSSASVPQTPVTGQDSGFFKFRFSNGSITRPTTPNPISPAVNGHLQLTSPSLPSLHSQLNKEVEELTAELHRERAAHRVVIKEKADIEAEIESLSQALFEEANKMVKTERIRRAETEEELKETRLEKEALTSALRVIEGENGRLRSMTLATQNKHAIQPDDLSYSSRSSSRVTVDPSLPSVTPTHPSQKPSTSAIEAPSSTPASYPPSPPPEPSDSTLLSIPQASPAGTSAELIPHEVSRFMPPAPFVADEQLAWANLKSKPQPLHASSLFPIPFSP